MDQWTWILCGIFSFFTILGNGGVIFLITARRNLRTTANWFVLSLAVADFLFGVGFLPVEKLRDVYPHSKNFYNLPRVVLSAASITNLCTMTLDRYIRIVHPLRYVTFMRPRRARLLITAAWVLALIRPLPNLKKLADVPRSVGKALLVLEVIFYQIMPCTLMLLATIVVLLIVRRQKKQSRKLEAQLRFNYPCSCQQGKRVSKTTQIQEAASARVMVVVVAVFLFTFSIRTLVTLAPSLNKHHIISKIFKVLVIINSAANPFAYALFKTDIRREMRLFCRGSKTSR